MNNNDEFAGWRKSSRSDPSRDCVEVGFAYKTVGIRDTKERAGGTLAVSAASWKQFLNTVRSGQLDD